jgi:hypothetical protein
VRRIIAVLASAIAIGFGLVMLIGLLAGDTIPLIATLTNLLLQLVVITVAVTILIGIINLLSVHIGRISQRRGGWVYSLVLLFSFLAVVILTVLERVGILNTAPGQMSPSMILLETVQVSIESALAGLLLFALVYGAYRMMRRRVTWTAILFTLVLLIVLLGALPLPDAGAFTLASDWLLAVPVSAGARGILLGIALATVVTGVRVLIGQDRSYRE